MPLGRWNIGVIGCPHISGCCDGMTMLVSVSEGAGCGLAEAGFGASRWTPVAL
jgi:hypothetical protein